MTWGRASSLERSEMQVCEYPDTRGGCDREGTVEIKVEIFDPETDQPIETKTVGWLCQGHSMEIIRARLGTFDPNMN